MNILEAYQKKLTIAESVYAKEHGNRQLSDTKKIAIARVLANTSEYLNEAFANSVGTQLGNMRDFKKFCLDLTTVALPNLIANDLVIVYPMKSRTGFIQYLQFTAGSNKGGIEQGEVFNDVFKLGKMDDRRVNYTSDAIVEPCKTGTFKASWNPIVKGVFYNEGDKQYYDAKVLDVNGGFVVFANFNDAGEITVAQDGKVCYKYDNVVIPQNDLPILNARMEGKALSAKARRIAVYYSQMAAFQAKTEMGIDLGEVLATQACAELSYEIDTEVVKLLDNSAEYDVDLKWNRKQPIGVGKRDHYAGFAEVIEIGSQKIYDKTQKHAANYMLIASNIKPILSLVEGWKPANTSKINGPYFAGELNGVKVYVSPAIKPGRFVLGYNGEDMVTSAAVYAPYMAIVPTQLLGYADGSMSQGFSTLYDLQMLNKDLLIAGEVVVEEYIIQNKVVNA